MADPLGKVCGGGGPGLLALCHHHSSCCLVNPRLGPLFPIVPGGSDLASEAPVCMHVTSCKQKSYISTPTESEVFHTMGTWAAARGSLCLMLELFVHHQVGAGPACTAATTAPGADGGVAGGARVAACMEKVTSSYLLPRWCTMQT